MPQIIVTADGEAAFGDGAVTLRERVSVADFESQHFATQLVERLGWAVADADRAERTVADVDRAERTVADPDRAERTMADADRAERGIADADRAEQFDDERVIARSPAW